MWPLAIRVCICKALFVLSVITPFASLTRAYVHDPTPVLRNVYGAPYAVLMILEVKRGMETQFLDAMVKFGPYSKLLSGFANERLLQPLPANEGKALFFCVTRYYDRGTEQFIESQRLPGLRPYLAKEPVRLDVSLVEHLLADWGWEKGRKQSVTRAEPFKNDEIFQKNISSLSFFKAGYVGQVGMLEFFPAATSLDQLRAAVTARGGISGASIFSTGGDGKYIVYSEFFKAPADVDRRGFDIASADNSVSGGQAGVVVQNYTAR